MIWRLHHRAETVSTNLDARAGSPGDVFTADYQSAGRGRLDHKWLAPRGTALMMSVVIDAAGSAPERVAVLPLVIGLSVIEAASRYRDGLLIKWPNDVLDAAGRKLAGILCERNGDSVIAGIGVNIRRWDYPEGIRALALDGPSADEVRDAVLARIGENLVPWHRDGLAPLLPRIGALDFLKGRRIFVRQTDDDAAPLCGIAEGIAVDGALILSGRRIYAGEAHVGLGQNMV